MTDTADTIFDNGTIKIIHDGKNGAVKIQFTEKPSAEIRKYIKETLHYRWTPRNNDWEHMDNMEAIEGAKIFQKKFFQKAKVNIKEVKDVQTESLREEINGNKTGLFNTVEESADDGQGQGCEYIATIRQAAAIISCSINRKTATYMLEKEKKDKMNIEAAKQKLHDGKCSNKMSRYYSDVIAGREHIPMERPVIAGRESMSREQKNLFESLYPDIWKKNIWNVIGNCIKRWRPH
jgi:hypothetical protein